MSLANSKALIQSQVELAPFTSWQIGGRADYLCCPQNLEELQQALTEAKHNSWPITVLGGGTNVLVSDEGVEGLVICLKNMTGLKSEIRDGHLVLEALSGTSKSDLLKAFLKNKLAPALFLAGLPGDVGGGVVMNAGVSEQVAPREFGELVDWVEVLRPQTLQVERISARQIRWSYRHSDGWQPGIIVRVGLIWPYKAENDILERVKKANLIRLSRQPLDRPSCGSVFVNPPNHKAAQLIEACGLKGYRIGDAQVSMKHSNFIVNTGKATACDTWQVIQDVQKKVLELKKVQLKTEVVLLGRQLKK
jgi:UDP-N-acetylmuramate dehydrogenase